MSQRQTQAFIKAVLTDNQTAIAKLYHSFRREVYPLVCRQFSGVPVMVAEEKFHDAVMHTVDVIRSTGQLEAGEVVSCKIDNAAGFIRVVMKRGIQKHLRGQKDHVDFEDYLAKKPVVETADDQTQLVKRVMQAFRKLAKHCQELLAAKQVHGESFKEIAAALASESGTPLQGPTDVKKKENQRRQEHFRCLRKFRKLYHELSTG